MGSKQLSTRVPGYYSVEPMRQELHNRLDSMPVGLRNLGSTCWFNVAVQLLYHIPKFRKAIMEWQDPSEKCPVHLRAFIENLYLLFVAIQYSEDKRLDPSHAVGTIGSLLGCGRGQQDASEYLALLLNKLRDAGMEVIEELFFGSRADDHGIEEFLQHTVLVQRDTDLKTALNFSMGHSPQILSKHSQQSNSIIRCFLKLPHIFLLDLSRLTLDQGTFIKPNYRLVFPSFFSLNQLIKKELEGETVLKPYQLLAVIVHHGETNAGHFSIDIWDQQQQSWFRIDDNNSEVITWEDVIQDGYGGLQEESSAYCLVYADATETKDILETSNEYDVTSTDVLNYLRDPVDVRTSNSSYGLGCTLEAARSIAVKDQLSAEAKLYMALENERIRLHCLCQKSKTEAFDGDSRLQHFVIYLMANDVDFEPFIYWALLIHFAGFKMQLKEETSSICTAARHALAYLEKSISTAEKNYFVQWNWCYHQFHLIARHLLSALDHMSRRNFSAAVPIAVTVLYLQYDLLEKSPKGPAISFNSDIFHTVIDKSLASLSDELLQANFESSAEEACMILFEAMTVWIQFSDLDNQKSVRSACQWLIKRWRDRVIANKNESGAAEMEGKLDNVQEILNNPPARKSRPVFKLHIRSPSTRDGPILAYHWSRVWCSFHEQLFSSCISCV